ncbi:hypothetical protein [Pectobacterium peruviense]|uniref:hypothetical protein n=1 Tax=Pectobacterium peruviense TaxID=2066479 RepID=UPI000DE35D6E|nr:hypothetical protein [Pectobacterium peruviense]
MARPARSHDNSSVRQWLIDNQDIDIPAEHNTEYSTGSRLRWIDDVLTGSGRLCESLNANTKPISPAIIYLQLLAHDNITTKVVQEFLSRKRIAFGEHMVSRRYASYVTTCVISASKSVEYHLVQMGYIYS